MKAFHSALVAVSVLLPTAFGQSTFVGVEPNGTKATATPAVGVTDGDLLESYGCAGFGLNYFRVQLAPRIPGIYRHTLRDAGSDTPSRVRIFGRDAFLGETLPSSSALLATSTDTDPSSPYVTWYGFGKSEELYTELATVADCRFGGNARFELESETIAPIDVGTLPSNAFSIVSLSAAGNSGFVDTEMHLFDAEFNAVPGGWSDDPSGLNTAAFMTRFLVPGEYYLAVSDKGLASHLPPSLFQTEWSIPRVALDFAGPFIATSVDAPVELYVSLSTSGSNPVTRVVTKDDPFEATWFRFRIGAAPSSSSFCPGDGSAGPCPCGNESAPGARMGCNNSTGRGATLMVSRQSPFQDRFDFALEDLPPFAGSLLYLGSATAGAQPSVAGLTCLGQGSQRAAVSFARIDGRSEVSFTIPAAFGFMVGQTIFAQAAYRDPAAAPGCRVNLTSGITLRL